jgi:hypothetical protein
VQAPLRERDRGRDRCSTSLRIIPEVVCGSGMDRHVYAIPAAR